MLAQVVTFLARSSGHAKFDIPDADLFGYAKLEEGRKDGAVNEMAQIASNISGGRILRVKLKPKKPEGES